MRVYIGIGIFFVSIIIFKWWGLLSLLFVLPFIGWKDRHKGPFYTPTQGVTDWDDGMNFHNKCPLSSRKMQDILVEIQNDRIDDPQLKNEIEELLSNLNAENFGDEGDKNQEKLMGFLNKFSAVFPNWKSEYQLIAKNIRTNF